MLDIQMHEATEPQYNPERLSATRKLRNSLQLISEGFVNAKATVEELSVALEEAREHVCAMLERENQSSKAVCGCDEANALRAELKAVKAERDFMLTGWSESEIRVMRQELAKERTL